MQKLFFLFWTFSALALEFYFRPAIHTDHAFHRDYIMLLLGTIGILAFGIPKTKSMLVYLLPIALIVLFQQSNIADHRHQQQFFMTMIGLLIFAQWLAVSPNKININCALNIIAIATLAQAFYILSDKAGFEINYELIKLAGGNPIRMVRNEFNQFVPGDIGMITGSLGGINQTGAILGIGFASLLRPIWWLGIPLVILAAYFLTGASPIVAAIISTIAYLVIRFDVKWWISSTLFVVVAICAYFFAGDSGRIEIWEKAYTILINNHQVLGFGLGSMAGIMKANYNTQLNIAQAHNEFIDLFWSLGTIGLCLCLWMLKTVFLGKKHQVLFPAFCGLMATCLWHFPFHVHLTAFFGIILISLNINYANGGHENENLFITNT